MSLLTFDQEVSCLSFFMPTDVKEILVQLEWTAWKLSKKWSSEPLYMAIVQTYYPVYRGWTQWTALKSGLHRGGRRFESCSAHSLGPPVFLDCLSMDWCPSAGKLYPPNYQDNKFNDR